jgi:anti-sigma factor RsiW
MEGPRPAPLIEKVLRCYPARWRRRHGFEAAELAALLIRDGTPASSIALSYLAGAAREWLTPRPSRRLSAVAGALLVAACSLGVSAGLLASAVPAKAASTSQPHGRAHCRPGSLESVPGVIPAPDHRRVIIWGAGRGGSC